jgi:hypothetical protein
MTAPFIRAATAVAASRRSVTRHAKTMISRGRLTCMAPMVCSGQANDARLGRSFIDIDTGQTI